MRTQRFALTLILSAACFVAACQPQDSTSPNSSSATAALTESPSPTQDSVNHIFVVTEEQLRKAFNDYEAKGEENQDVSIGEKRAVDISVPSPHGTESLKLSIMFLPPLEQARHKGYEFGLVGQVENSGGP
ncbi:MAG: hypothetical protein M3410_08040 [Acidobacteriota bacterium]|nr:hypothetical protein [Acidobacteriota bacterium]